MNQLLSYVDRDRIYQVLSNLLNNAIKFTKNGTISINTRVNYSSNNQDQEVIVTIKDTGSGIPVRINAKAFLKICYFIQSRYRAWGFLFQKAL